jgi:hypothetical protein
MWCYSEIFVFVVFFIPFAKVTKSIVVFVPFFVYLCAAYATIVLFLGHVLTTNKAQYHK